MTPRELLDAFEVVAEAPDGVKRLRELVLQLAVRGKLVPQDAGDEPASVLLERIAVEVGSRRTRDPAISSPNGLPYDLPGCWTWCRLGELANPQAGFAFQSSFFNEVGDGVPLIRIRDVLAGTTATYYSGEYRAEFVVESGEYLIGMDGNFNVGRWSGGRAVLNQRVTRLQWYTHEVVPAFVVVALQHRLDALQGEKAYTTVQHLSGKQIANAAIPLPPLAEQHRIVARVDELMGLLDRLEAARKDRDATRETARDSALAALRNADTPDEVEVAWNRIAERMPALFTRPADLEPLRQAVLQLAVRGRIVRQDPKDEPASVLLERIAAEKARLVKAGKIRKADALPPVAAEDVPFVAVDGWSWSRLGGILWHCRNGTSAQPNEVGAGYPLLRISAGTSRRDAVVDVSDHKFADVSTEHADSYRIRSGDLLACRFNGNLGFVGRVARVPADLHGVVLHPDKLICLRAVEIAHEFLVVAVNAGPTRRQIESVAATTAGNIGVNGKQVQALIVPIPPLAEQHRIVAKVDALMALIDQLEARLTAAQTLHAQFAAAAVHRLDA